MKKEQTATQADNTAVSSSGSPTALATSDRGAVVESSGGDVSGPLSLVLSQEIRDNLALELQEALHQIEQGFGELTAPGKIYEMQAPFYVIDAITIHDYVDRRTGEEKVKHIFRLEFDDGRIVATMQSDARPRRVLATAFGKARALGARLKAGPFLYAKKRIEGQIQEAFIFEQQKGFEAVVS